MRSNRKWMSALCFGLFAALVARAETVDDVEKALQAKYDKLTSMTAKFKSNSEIGTDGKMDADGTMEMMKAGDKLKFHTQAHSKTVMSGTNMEGNTSQVCDGEYVYTVSDMAGNKSAMKQKVTPDMIAAYKNPIAILKKDNDITLGKDETVEGKTCWTLEVKPKSASAAAAKSVQMIDKDSGVTLKTLTYDGSGKVISTSIVTDVKLGASIPDDHFVFKAPEGVTVMDMDKMGGGGGGGSTGGGAAGSSGGGSSGGEAKPSEPAKPAEPAKPSEPPKDEPKKDDKPKKPGLPKLPK